MSGILQRVTALLRDKIKRIHCGNNVRPFLVALPAFVVVGALFLYCVNWFSEAKIDANGGEVQKAAGVILRKFSDAVTEEPALFLPNKPMAFQSLAPADEIATFQEAQAAAGSLETNKIVRKLPSPPDDTRLIPETEGKTFRDAEISFYGPPAATSLEASASPEEPDPGSAIDYILKKRKF
jgi:hypothetical protein